MTTATVTCEGRFWREGRDQHCGQVVGLAGWSDTSGTLHYACSRHYRPLLRRYPSSLPARLPNRGRLYLSTPWARGAFGPADRIEIANLIPRGWTIDVAVSGDRRYVLLRALGPDDQRPEGIRRPFRNTVEATREFAASVALLARGELTESEARYAWGDR